MVVWWFWHLAEAVQIQKMICNVQTLATIHPEKKGWDRQIIIKPVTDSPCASLSFWIALPPWRLAFGSCNFGNLLDPMVAPRPGQAEPERCCGNAGKQRAWKTSMLPGTRMDMGIWVQHLNIWWWILGFESHSRWFLPQCRWFRTGVDTYPPETKDGTGLHPQIAHFQSQKSQHVATVFKTKQTLAYGCWFCTFWTQKRIASSSAASVALGQAAVSLLWRKDQHGQSSIAQQAGQVKSNH